jgi:hypothetical protein
LPTPAARTSLLAKKPNAAEMGYFIHGQYDQELTSKSMIHRNIDHRLSHCNGTLNDGGPVVPVEHFSSHYQTSHIKSH